MVFWFSNVVNRKLLIEMQYFTYNGAVCFSFNIWKWGKGDAHLCREWSLPLFCKPPWMSHPASSSLDKTMPSQGIALQRQKGLASIHRNIGMPSCYFIHIKGWILHDFFVIAAAWFVLFCLPFLLLRGFNCFPFFSEKADMLPAFFQLFARQGREMLGGTAVRNLQQHSESGSCLWMSVSLSPLLEAPEDILYEWRVLLPGRQRCCAAADFQETCGLFGFVVLFVISLTFT